MSAQRGRCPVCRNQHPLRKDGSIGTHPAKTVKGLTGTGCPGTGKAPVPLLFNLVTGIPDCAGCAMHMFTPGLGGAISETAFENGGDPQKMLRDLLTAFHVAGHKEPGGGR